MNKELNKLYIEFDNLYHDIGLICQKCHDHDCEGYVWLLKDEAELLADIEVSIIEVNDSAFFIHSFEEENGVIKVDKPKPPCYLKKSGLCSIYENRPLVCRMYPIGFAMPEEDIAIVLHEDCEYSRRLKPSGKKEFFYRFFKILNQISNSLINELFDSYQKVNRLSAFPEGPNAFEVVATSEVILRKGGNGLCQNVKQSWTARRSPR